MTESVLNVQVTENDIVNTNAETDLLSYSVPANTLGTTGVLRINIICDYLNTDASTSTVTLKVKYGATTLYDDATIAFPALTTTRYPIVISLTLFAKNATNSQGCGGNILIGTTGGATTGIGSAGTDEINALTPLVGANASEDSTAAKTFVVTVTHSVAGLTTSFRRLYSVIESVDLTVSVPVPTAIRGRAFGGIGTFHGSKSEYPIFNT